MTLLKLDAQSPISTLGMWYKREEHILISVHLQGGS